MENLIDYCYEEIISRCMGGHVINTRNSECRRWIAGYWKFWQIPLVSARRTAWKNALREWEWFMSGSNRIEDLHPSVRQWWEPWVNDAGIVPFNYGYQFSNFAGSDIVGTIDQIKYLVDGIRNHPFSRRNVITTWNTADMADSECPITNCHGTVIQAFVNPDDSLHLATYQRSADVICGLPHNWVQYWAFLMWLAHRGGRSVGSLTWVGGDVHVYKQHYELADKILRAATSRKPGNTPNLVYTPTSEEFKADDFTLDGEYTPVLTDRAEMVV